MRTPRGFTLTDCLIALIVSLIAASSAMALTRSAASLYRQYQLDRVIADVTDHLQNMPARLLTTETTRYYDRDGNRSDRQAWLSTRIRPEPIDDEWSEVTCTVTVHHGDGQDREYQLKRLVWRP